MMSKALTYFIAISAIVASAFGAFAQERFDKEAEARVQTRDDARGDANRIIFFNDTTKSGLRGVIPREGVLGRGPFIEIDIQQ